MKTLHTIKMVCRKDGIEVVYKEVEFVAIENGGTKNALTVLHLADGNTASFPTLEWDFWDLTPQRGWNYNVD